MLVKPLDLQRLVGSVARAVTEHRAAMGRKEALDSAVRPRGTVQGTHGGGAITPGTVLADRYRIVRLLGIGGMGAVYEAEREDLAHMPVAIKVVHPTLAGRADLMRRFRREAEVVAAIHHPNIVHVLDFVSDAEGRSVFLVMELLQGSTLSAAIEHHPPFSESRVAFVGSQILAALEAAHAVHVVHRDLKPDNVFLTTIANIGDVVKLLDFGIAKLMDSTETKLTETGTVLGTPAYMAPEYARGEKVDALGDIYAVGCVLYEALARRAPFVAANYNALLFAIQEKEPAPLRDLRPDVSPDLVRVIARAMAKDPSARYPSARAMKDALASWIPRPSERVTPSTAPSLSVAPTEPAGHPKPRRVD